MTLIAETAALAEFCRRQRQADFIAVDTEFMRDRTYWPQLCLVQIAGPEEAAAIDTLAPGIDLAPLFELMADPKRPQGLPCRAPGRGDLLPPDRAGFPHPLVDTQVAAMVCGFGDSVSYETLAGKLAGARIDKSSRFTDWAQRPLTDRQLHYALADVTHLRPAYEHLERRLDKTGRSGWVAEEMAVLTSPATYRLDPREAWRRIKSAATSRAPSPSCARWRPGARRRRSGATCRAGASSRTRRSAEIAAHAPTRRRAISPAAAASPARQAESKQGAGHPRRRQARPRAARRANARRPRRAATCRRAWARSSNCCACC